MTYISKRRTGALRSRLGLATIAALVALPAPLALSADSGGLGTGGGGGSGAGASTAADGGVFPLKGKHSYGDGIGAGRGHQGVDIMAKCGKPVVASYPGRVQLRDYHSAAGNYVVVDGAGNRLDTAYMHLSAPTKLRKNQRVQAGALIGRVGDTGSASACHLHFEMWSQPGWYEGGSPVDPMPYLKRWDRG